MRWILSLLLALNFSPEAAAEIAYQSKTQDEVGLTVGSLLPWGLPGVRDQYRLWGLSYFHPSSIWDLEYEFLNGRGGEVTYYVGTVSGRFDYSIYGALDLFLNVGLAYHYYKRKPSSTQDFPFRSTAGLFLGFGGLIEITPAFKFRGEVKFHNNPGKSLYIGIGPSFVF